MPLNTIVPGGGGSIPFTGLWLVPLLLAAAVLILCGLVAIRIAKRNRRARRQQALGINIDMEV